MCKDPYAHGFALPRRVDGKRISVSNTNAATLTCAQHLCKRSNLQQSAATAGAQHLRAYKCPINRHLHRNTCTTHVGRGASLRWRCPDISRSAKSSALVRKQAQTTKHHVPTGSYPALLHPKASGPAHVILPIISTWATPSP